MLLCTFCVHVIEDFLFVVWAAEGKYVGPFERGINGYRSGIWKWFASNFLTQPAYFISLIVAIGYILLKKKWYDVLAGFLKAVIGYQILLVGSGGLVTAFRPVLVGLEARFNLSAMVIDPYFGQNAVQAQVWRQLMHLHLLQVVPSLCYASSTFRFYSEHCSGCF